MAELAERRVKIDDVQVWRFAHAEGPSFNKSVLPAEQLRLRVARPEAGHEELRDIGDGALTVDRPIELAGRSIRSHRKGCHESQHLPFVERAFAISLRPHFDQPPSGAALALAQVSSIETGLGAPCRP